MASDVDATNPTELEVVAKEREKRRGIIKEINEDKRNEEDRNRSGKGND
jgi:hypothetical protein